MITYDRYNWRSIVCSVRGSAVSRAAGRIFLMTAIAVAVQLAYEAEASFFGLSHASIFNLEPVEHAVLGSLLGFLLVFRMNASNGRYWEGRSHWGQIINSSRNLTRVGIEHTDSRSGAELADLVSAYSISVRRTLHGEMDAEETELFLGEGVRREIVHFGNPPTAVAAAISEWIGRQQRAGRIDSQLVRHLEDQLSKLVDAQGGCEKIQKTPLPFVYVVMIKQLILVYLLTLPIAVCNHCGWWTPVLVAIVSAGLFGIEEASVEIEDPFGKDDNCLDMETFTLGITRDTGQMAARKARQTATLSSGGRG
jgi:ion channel-forming bestrophin family protein